MDVTSSEWTELGERLQELNPERFDRVIEKIRAILEAEEVLAIAPRPAPVLYLTQRPKASA